MNLNLIKSTLEAAGAEIEMMKSGDSRALVLRRLPRLALLESISAGDSLWIVQGDVGPLLEAGAAVVENGMLILDKLRIPVLRISKPGLRPADIKVPEGPGNLKGRAGWFGKRGGPSQ